MSRCIATLAVVALLWPAFLTGCAGRDAVVRDLAVLPQAPSAFLDKGSARPLLPGARQEWVARDFLARHFRPWHDPVPLYPAEKVFWGIQAFEGRELFGQNTRQRDPEWFQALVRLSDCASYPNADFKAVTVTHADLRVMPTREPAFFDFSLPGEGYPFDMFQNSALWAGTPVHVSHVSLDGAWVLAEAGLVYGWLPVGDVARVGEGLARELESGEYLTPVRDGAPVSDEGGVHSFSTRVGSLHPLVGQGNGGWAVLTAVRDAQGRARARRATVPMEAGRRFPVPLVPEEIAGLAGTMTGQPYGWGGMYWKRDCSALLRDLFAAFGLWLPRNSSGQARAGLVIPLEGLTMRDKEQAILETGLAWATLLHRPGHTMLYIGEHEGRPVVWHAMWGAKTRTPFRGEGRLVVGQTVVTTLTPGVERWDVHLRDSLLAGLRSMNILVIDPEPPWP